MKDEAVRTVEVFDFNQWKNVKATDLQLGNIIRLDNETYLVKRKDGEQHYMVEPFSAQQEVIGNSMETEKFKLEYPSIFKVMNYIGCGITKFEDDTALITEIDSNQLQAVIFSPRLPLAKLEIHCSRNIASYRLVGELIKETGELKQIERTVLENRLAEACETGGYPTQLEK